MKNTATINYRLLNRDELPAIWKIDRREIVNNIYYYRPDGLELIEEFYNVPGWPPGEPEQYGPMLGECYQNGGWFWGAFEADRLVGTAILTGIFCKSGQSRLQLLFLHVSRGYRHTGIGRTLFESAVKEARHRQAKEMVISATPSENTIHFYLIRGCIVDPHPDPDMLQLEPEDIHLTMLL